MGEDICKTKRGEVEEGGGKNDCFCTIEHVHPEAGGGLKWQIGGVDTAPSSP